MRVTRNAVNRQRSEDFSGKGFIRNCIGEIALEFLRRKEPFGLVHNTALRERERSPDGLRSAASPQLASSTLRERHRGWKREEKFAREEC